MCNSTLRHYTSSRTPHEQFIALKWLMADHKPAEPTHTSTHPFTQRSTIVALQAERTHESHPVVVSEPTGDCCASTYARTQTQTHACSQTYPFFEEIVTRRDMQGSLVAFQWEIPIRALDEPSRCKSATGDCFASPPRLLPVDSSGS